MKNKDRYFKALIKNNGRLNEIDLGEKFGFNEDKTREIITQLISEHKIEYMENGACNYTSIKTTKWKNKSR